ncbi:hypothetical protein HBH70_009510 [Parastagonospora nodorum]|nr:hypothetical protein HBH51_011220 [Parastagonospora nodorum]KAH4073296.1 hypothetical protein HBH50_052200 [Parastagonospora nodorum]KAH4099645.1 hypothetical protein HBH48_009950 [Parastagonospora nodorum]KAH4235137.1 hypothetical protein HBI06_058010 [Parastagonospora nodorum]KAH4249809.1 hypothetical protein HBI05_010230 [Parastagonospora nodorum]
MEEQVGLLQQEETTSRESSESYIEHDLLWKEAGRTTRHSKPRRRWTTIVAVTVLIICTLGFLLNFAIARPNRPEAVNAAPAQIRPEEDYILDPAWDFDAAPTMREYTWIISDHEHNPDGVYRPMVLINATFPGPMIECNEGDEIIVHVHNRGVNATSIHWHGLYQNGTNSMDGTVGVTQCPIPSGRSFTYRFNVTGQSGTYYYHSHMSMQASDGLVGPLVIHARDGEEKTLQKVPYEQDRVVMLSDYYYDLSSELLVQYLAPGNENDEPVPPSALINGRNLRECEDLPNRKCSATGVSRARFDLERKSSTRLRILNVGAFAEFSLQIDEHEFQVTEVDGTDVYPQSIQRLNINPGQRYSIILTPPKDENKGLYWMRARMITHCFAYENPELQEEVWGVVDYTSPSSSTLTPQTTDWTETIEVQCRDLNTTSLTPVLPLPAPESADHTLFLRSSFQIRDHALSRGYLNDSSLRLDATKPVLHTLLDPPHSPSSSSSSEEIGDGINTSLFNPLSQLVYQTHTISTVDIVLQNFDDGNHPFHLHGHKFWVMGAGRGYAPANLGDVERRSNPLRRDTASLQAFGWLWIRFVADNPGAWAFRCHVGWHAEAGLGMVFATKVEDMEVVQEGMGRELCGVGG